VIDSGPASAFVDKWLARWPEWRVAEVFVATPQREPIRALFALRQELLDAAWGGDDPRPGEAKLGWWMEELHGWALGRRRHPLGAILQRLPAPWSDLATAAASLPAARDAAASAEQARAALADFAKAVVAIDTALAALPTSPSPDVETACLLCDQILLRGDAAAPLQVRAGLGSAVAETTASRAWATEIERAWPRSGAGSRAARIAAALKRERLSRFAQGQPLAQALPRWSAPWTAWKAARS
jgi:phytoene/squalene synthetase